MARYIDADKFKKHLETAIEKMHLIAGVKAVPAEAVVKALDMQPTAEVVPKSEVERLQYILDSYALQYGTVVDKHTVVEKERTEVAREIFEEIEKFNRKPLPECQPVYIIKERELAELKKKYTEGNNEKQ